MSGIKTMDYQKTPVMMGGSSIVFSEMIPEFASRYEERFIEYEPSDEVWRKYFGFGKLVKTNEPYILAVDEAAFRKTTEIYPGKFLMHENGKAWTSGRNS